MMRYKSYLCHSLLRVTCLPCWRHRQVCG